MPRLDSIPCECTCKDCGAVCAPDKVSRMCAQCQNRMNKTVQRGVYNNPKHWPPDWIASRLNIPLLGREPLQPPEWAQVSDMINPEVFDQESSALAARLQAEDPEEDPDQIRPEDYVPMYGDQPYPEDDEDEPAYVGDDYIGADLSEPTARPAAPATPAPPAAPLAPLYVREPDPEPVAANPAPESLPVFQSSQGRLEAAQEEVRQLSAQVFELEADNGHLLYPHFLNGAKEGGKLARFLTWLTGIKRVRGEEK